MRKRLVVSLLLISAFVAMAAAPGLAWKFAITSDSQGADNGVNTSMLANFVNRINAEGVDLMLVSGDIVSGTTSDSGLASQYDTWKSVMANLNCPYYIVPGNHDIYTATSENVWRSKFSMPTNGPTGYSETTYSFDHQNAHFVGLNSAHYGYERRISQAWLENDLNNTSQQHIFVMAHHPAYPKGPHIGSSLDDYPAERDAFWNTLQAHNTRVFFAGHEHIYSWMLHGSVYQCLQGPSGGGPRCCYPDSIGGYYNYVVVTVNGANIHGEAKTDTGQVIHTWDIITDGTPPGPVTNFVATAGDGAVNLSWHNPSDADFVGTTVRYKTTGYPVSATDGTLACNKSNTPGSNDSFVHTGRSNGTTYYYAAFAHDGANYSTQANAVATPTGTYCFTEAFSYANGALNGNGEWAGSAGSDRIAITDQHVYLYGGDGGFDAVKAVNCGAGGSGYIPVTIEVYPGTGARTIWNLWLNDGNGLNLARWYGTANSARGRIGDTASVTSEQSLVAGWNTLLVKIFPATNNSQFFFNGVDIGTLSHASQGAGDVLARIRLESIDNWEAVGHYLVFDDLAVGEETSDTTPPGPVTTFVSTFACTQNNLSWTNPGDADFAGTMIRFKTTGFPANPTDGTLIYNGTGTSYAHTGLTLGVTYYYSAFSYDEVPNYAAAAQASSSSVPPAPCFTDLFSYSNGALVGQGGWTGNATASHIEVTGGYVRVWGGKTDYYAQKNVNCAAVCGSIWVRINVNGETGSDTMWSLRINDSAGKNLARWYGSGTTARGRIGDTSLVTAVQNLSGAWQELAVRIDPVANTSEFFFAGNSIGTLSHASTGAGDVVQQLKLERVNNNNATSQHLYFDDLRVGPN